VASPRLPRQSEAAVAPRVNPARDLWHPAVAGAFAGRPAASPTSPLSPCRCSKPLARRMLDGSVWSSRSWRSIVDGSRSRGTTSQAPGTRGGGLSVGRHVPERAFVGCA
jgi:hypothetical protein